MRSSKGEATSSRTRRSRDEPVFDIISAVKGLHELNAQQLSKLIRDSGSNVIQHIAEDGTHIQIDVEKFARHLPRHFIAVIMSWERDKSTFKYLLCGILLLHAMCDPAARVPKIEQILLDDLKVSEELIDMVFYLLVVLGTYRQENHHAPNDMILLHSALVACSLKLLTVVISPQFQEVAQVLTAYYKVDIFMDAAFAAVCIDVKVLQEKLSAEHAEASANTSPTHEETLIHLCQQCDCSLQFLQSLCQQKLFRERIVKNKELCGNGGVLLMVHAVMNLKLSPLYSVSSHMASISRLKSKALSILLHLCEAESVSYLDEVASNELSQKLTKSIALKVLDLLKKTFGIDSIAASSKIVNLKGQLELNAIRLADFFSDDSNFRSFIMINFTEALAAIFLLPHGEFLSCWCSSNLPNCENDASLDVPWESYAHHITSLLIKVIANLHCFVPDVCQDEKDLFLSKFVRCLQKKPQSMSDGFSSTFDTRKNMKVSKNLCSLLSHAESLVPRFLNEEDVQLLRLFISQFESQIASAASGDPIVQVAQNTEAHTSPLQTEAAANHNGDINIEECLPENVTIQEVTQLNISRNGNDQSIDGERDEPVGASIHLRETDRDARIVETSGSDSSPTRGKNDRMDSDHVRGSGFEETLEDEKIDAMHSDERQQRKRKRTVMNDKQIALIESALVDEPDMHRNSASLRLWAEELSRHGAEVTTSRLKNWLNNRKARLARVAKDVRGDNLERQGHSGSPQSPADVPFAGGSNRNEVKDTAHKDSVDEDSGASLSTPVGGILRSGLHFEAGQYVLLIGEKAEEIGRGKIFQVSGKWCGRSLEQSGICVVDIFDLSVDRFANLLYPTEVTGNSFDQAEKRLGLMRVLWDLDKLFMMLPPH